MTYQSPSVPRAKIVSYTFEHQGHTLADEYAWLQNKADPEVIAYLEAENAYAQASLAPTVDLQNALYEEMKGRIQEDDRSVPEQRGNYLYYWYVQPGKQYRVFCRRLNQPEAPEVILLDENVLAEGLSYCRVATFEPSPDQRYLAYSVDVTGAWMFNLYVMDLHSGNLVSGPIYDTGWGIAWSSDNKTLFYTLFDAVHRPYQLKRHSVGSASDTDLLVYEEIDEAYHMQVERTRSGAFVLMTLASATTTEVHYLPADQPYGDFKVIHPRQHWHEYYVEHHGERFLIRTNDGAENFQLMSTPVENPVKANWQLLLAHRADTLIEEVQTFAEYLVVLERQHGLKQIRLSDPDGISNVRYVAFPEPDYMVRLETNPEFATNRLRFIYTSLVTPIQTVDYDILSGTWDIRKRQEIPSGYDPALYETERIYANASDDVQVPISVVYRKGLIRDGSHPLLLYAYGSYGFSSDVNFDTNRLSLLDRGFVYAIAHIRGGSEMGRAWYENGRLMHKKNSFTDFIACAEHLIDQRYTGPDKLVIMGASAGGLLVTAVSNMRPALFKAVLALVPFTNVITAILSPDLPLTVIEYEQWGHPNDPLAFDYMLSYSPYENIEAKSYPHMLVKAGLNDLQVPFWDPAKWVARLRARKTDNNRLLLLTNMGAGHGGASGRYDKLHENAEMYAFVIDAISTANP